MTEFSAVPAITAAAPRGNLLARLLRNPMGVVALSFLGLVALVAVFGRLLAPYDPRTASLRRILAPPSSEHLLGADSAGRDVLSRLLAATQISIGAALVALVIALVIGVIAGLLAGYYRGIADAIASWTSSVVMALPAIIVLLAARVALGSSVWVSMAIFGILLSPAFFRLVYASVSAVRNELYVDAARVSGLSDFRIITRHILSVVRAPIIIQSAIVLGIAIAVQSGLEFLGLGDLSVPTWGSMLNDGFASIYQAPILMLWPSLAIGLTSMALVLVANVTRDELERTTSARRNTVAPTPAERNAPSSVQAKPSASATGETLLSVKDLVVGYAREDGTRNDVVKSVSLEIARGEVHGLIGESGSGKTQTAFAILGLLPAGGRVVSGSIDFRGTQLVGASEAIYRTVRGKRIGYIPQEPMSNLDPSFTIGSQLVEPMRVVLGLSRKEAEEKALGLLEQVGISDPRRTFRAHPHEVSGGMAQRVLIAGAVSCDPELLIADEPTTALDVTVQAEVLDVLRDLQQERQLGVLLVTHNFGLVADLCDRVSVMQSGRFVETGDVRSLFADPQHAYTKSLFDAVLEDKQPRGPLAAGQEVVA